MSSDKVRYYEKGFSEAKERVNFWKGIIEDNILKYQYGIRNENDYNNDAKSYEIARHKETPYLLNHARYSKKYGLEL